jgi:hypothetical protein
MNGPSWPSTVIGLGFMALIGAIFLSVFYKSGIDPALKAWGAIGTLAGVVTGAIPTYFFGQARAKDVKDATAQAQDAVKAAAEQSRGISQQAQQMLEAERALRSLAEQRAELLQNLADPAVVQQARARKPELFGLE